MFVVARRRKDVGDEAAHSTIDPGLRSAAPSSLDWQNKVVHLEYPFAGRRLGVVRFAGRATTNPWSAIEPMPHDDDAVAQLSRASVAQCFSHPITASLPRITIARGAIRYVTRQYTRYTIDTTGLFDNYLMRLHSKTRQTLKRKVRLYCAHVAATNPWRRFVTMDDLREFHGLARRLSEQTYQERVFRAGLPQWREFADIVEQVGSARGYLLYHGAAPTAFLFTPISQGRAVYTSLGFDAAYAAWSPGAVLQYFAVESMFHDPEVRLLDFAEGNGQHKSTFATTRTLCADVHYFRVTVSTVAAIASHLIVTAVDRVATQTCDRLGLKSRLRKILRHGAACGRSRTPLSTTATAMCEGAL